MANLQTSLRKTICFLILISIFYILFIYNNIVNIDRSQFTFNESLFDEIGDKKILIAFRNDDLSINSNAIHEETILNLFWQYGVKQTFAFIPGIGNKIINSPNFLSKELPIVMALDKWIKQGKIEYALHGYRHKKSTGSSGEFKGLSYKSQIEKISDGKEILNKTFNSNVNIFAPPWNQADNNTVKACLNSGIHIFSGYLGELPVKGVTFVNTNAILFSKANPIDEGRGLPTVEDVLTHAKKCMGTTFIIAFYHSRNDFKNPKDYSYLIRLLNNIANDPLIEISSIGEIAEKYKDLLPAYNQAGLNLKQAAMSQDRAKPYLLISKRIQKIIGKDVGIDIFYNDAFYAYWSGNYKMV
jgi:hypothetical protein